MARVQALIQLTDDLIAQLDDVAARTGESRSALVRRAVVELLASDREAVMDAAWVAGYTRKPQARETAAERRAFRQYMRELAEEERKAGFDPW